MLLLYHTSDKSTTHSGRKLYLSDNLYLLNLIFQHPLDFITHGFGAGIAEMDAHFVGGLSDFPDQHRNFFLRAAFWVIFSLHIGTYTPFPDTLPPGARVLSAPLVYGFNFGIQAPLPPLWCHWRSLPGSFFRQRG